MEKSFLRLTPEEKSRIKVQSIVIVIAVLIASAVLYFQNIVGGAKDLISTMSPFITGFVIAYLLNRPRNFFMEQLNNSSLKNQSKALSIVIAYIVFFAVIGGFIGIVVPQITHSGDALISNVTNNLDKVEGVFNTVAEFFGISGDLWSQIDALWKTIVDNLSDITATIIPSIMGFVTGLTSAISNMIISIIVSIYMLIEKDNLLAQFKRFTYAFFPEKLGDKLVSVSAMTDNIFGKYIIGQLTVAFILGVMTFVVMTVLGLPYAMLISVIAACTNVIPYFGPYIGAVPSVFIILIENPTQALIYVVVVIVLQQIDGNIISPKIMGGSLGLSGVWILFAITIGGGMFGLLGMIIGAPTFAVVYNLLGELIGYNLKNKGREDLMTVSEETTETQPAPQKK